MVYGMIKIRKYSKYLVNLVIGSENENKKCPIIPKNHIFNTDLYSDLNFKIAKRDIENNISLSY